MEKDIDICESKGGVKFELIISESSPSKNPKKLSKPKRDLSLTEIKKKLEAAERRRLSQELMKQKQIAQRLNHIIDVQKNKEYSIQDFQLSVQQKYDWKMKICRSNREAYLSLIRSKNRELMARVKEVKNATFCLKQNHFDGFCKRFERVEKSRQKQLSILQEQLSEQDKKLDDIREKLNRLFVALPIQDTTTNMELTGMNE